MPKLGPSSQARVNLLVMKARNNLREALRVSRAVGDDEITVILARAEQALELARGDVQIDFEKPAPLPPAA